MDEQTWVFARIVAQGGNLHALVGEAHDLEVGRPVGHDSIDVREVEDLGALKAQRLAGSIYRVGALVGGVVAKVVDYYLAILREGHRAEVGSSLDPGVLRPLGAPAPRIACHDVTIGH